MQRSYNQNHLKANPPKNILKVSHIQYKGLAQLVIVNVIGPLVSAMLAGAQFKSPRRGALVYTGLLQMSFTNVEKQPSGFP